MHPRSQTKVLVVGAGPTGMVLALWLRRAGIDVRIIEKLERPSTTSRALAVHARTLELYRQLGLADDVVSRGLQFAAVNLWVRGGHAARVAFGEIGHGLSPFPFILMFSQDQHEELLVKHLRRAGLEIERRTELVGLDGRGDRIVARLKGPDGAETTCEASFVAGCDGTHSKVREELGIRFPGGTYERVFYVADVTIHGRVDDHELHVALDEADLLAVFPMKGEHAARLIGTVRRDAKGEHDLTWEDVSPPAVERLGITVDRVHWFSTYRVHHRVADTFRAGSAFLAGDAAHIHSPVGGQGMNTGIGDAINLAWKLAAVLHDRADPKLLDSYESERIAFARRLVATTDRAFTFVSRDGALARRLRLDLVPRLAPALLNRTAARRFMFRTISQTAIHYRNGDLSEGKAGSVRGGDRLPWVAPLQTGAADNFTPLTSIDWQLHVYGKASPEIAGACVDRRLALHTFAWEPRMETSGLARNAAYLVRPDGYVALADWYARAAKLERYVDARGLRFR